MTFRAVVLTATLAITLAACSTEAPPTSSPSTSPAASPSTEVQLPPADLWTAGIATTSTIGGVTMESQIVTNVEGFERIVMGEGYVHVPSGSGDMTWTDERSTIREVRTDQGHYVGFDDLWYSETQDLPTTIAFEPLAGLATAVDIREEDPSQVLGIPTRTLTATLDTDALLMGVSTEELTVLDPSSGTLTATIWVDDADRIVRIVREYRTVSLDGDPIDATALFLLSDLGDSRPIDVPETADAIPAPS